MFISKYDKVKFLLKNLLYITLLSRITKIWRINRLIVNIWLFSRIVWVLIQKRNCKAANGPKTPSAIILARDWISLHNSGTLRLEQVSIANMCEGFLFEMSFWSFSTYIINHLCLKMLAYCCEFNQNWIFNQ